MSGQTLCGVLLVLPIVFVAIETLGYRHSLFGKSSFWRLPLGDKLDHIAAHTRKWWLVHLPWPPSVAALTAGLAGLAYLLDDAIAWASFGAFVLAAVTWLVAATQQGVALTVAAQQRSETGTTPDWVAGTWRVGYVLEGIWILLGNIAAAGYGVAVIRTDLLAQWLGWAALVVGLAIPITVVLTRDGFPHLVLPVPLTLGVALLLT